MVTAILHDVALQGVILLTLIAALGDFGTGVLSALRSGAFKLDLLAGFVASHLLARALPIILVAGLASILSAAVSGIENAPAVLTGAIAAAWAAAWAGTLAYLLETLASLQSNIKVAAGGDTPA